MINDDTIINVETYKSDGGSNKNNKLVFFDALNYLNFHATCKDMRTIEKNRSLTNIEYGLKKSFSDTFENNISEYSITQANFSIEEHEVNIPLKKQAVIINNRVYKIPIDKKNFTHANIPYQTRVKRSSYLGGENGNTSSHINSQNKQDIIEGLFTVFNNKVIGSTTFDSKKSKSNIKYISFEEFRNLNCHEKISDIKDDKSLSGIMRSYHDFDINDLDILKDIYIDKSKESVNTRKINTNDLRNNMINNINKISLNNSKSDRSAISKVDCSKILIIDSNNISLEKNLCEDYTELKRKNRKNNNYFNEDIIERTASKEEYLDMSNNWGEKTVSKKIHRSRISRLISIESNLTNKLITTDQKKIIIKNIVSENNSLDSDKRNSLQLSHFLKNIKVNFEKINQTNSGKSSSKRIIKRNLLENFNVSRESDQFLSPKSIWSTNDEKNFLTPKEKVRKNWNNLYQSSQNISLEYKIDSNYINTVFDVDFVNNLLKQEKEKVIDPNYMVYHPLLKPEFRSILINWLNEISEEFAFKRDTFHYAARYIDIFLSYSKNFSNTTLQLLGIVALSLAAKIEEIQIPKIEDYLKTTDSIFDDKEFLEFEKSFLKIIKWNLIPSNLNLWLNWYLCQWDIFIDSFDEIREKFLLQYNKIIYFRKPDEEAYFIFRQITQIIDLIVLDINYLSFSQREIIAATFFIVIGQNLNIFDDMNRLNDLNYLLKVTKNNFLSNIFSEFLIQSFGFNMQSIYLSLIFVAKFTQIKFSVELPLIAQTDEEVVSKGHYEEFLSYQAYNPENYFFISNYLTV